MAKKEKKAKKEATKAKAAVAPKAEKKAAPKKERTLKYDYPAECNTGELKRKFRAEARAKVNKANKVSKKKDAPVKEATKKAEPKAVKKTSKKKATKKAPATVD